MMVWLWVFLGILIGVSLGLGVKVAVMRKAAKEMREYLTKKQTGHTNILIDIASRDGQMLLLADGINRELRGLREARHRFEQGDLEIKEAVTNISHDIRTPLTAICGYLDLLKKEEMSGNAVRYVNMIENRAEVLKQLTEELFRYSLVSSAGGNDPLEAVVINAVLEESISAYYAVLNGCGIVPVIFMPKEKVIRNVNRKDLSRIFGNVLGNAVKYSNGDLKISLSTEGRIVFSNHAPNLDEVQVGKLFDRFYTVEDAKKSTGLGLSIARTLTERMGGEITAAYEKGVLKIGIWFPG